MNEYRVIFEDELLGVKFFFFLLAESETDAREFCPRIEEALRVITTSVELVKGPPEQGIKL